MAKGDLKNFPIDPMTLEVELTLRVFPSYSDTAPYDCPKTKQILEEAWKVLETRFVVDPKKPGSGKGGVLEANALVASGKPEHRKIVHDWVRSKNSPWGPGKDPDESLYLLARIGDAQSLAALKKAAEFKDPAECSSAVLGLSYSPNREADKILLDLAASDPKRAAIVGNHAVRRMAIGPKGFGDISNAQAVAFADALLNFNLSDDVVVYLGMIPDARAMNSLLFCLKKGYTRAAESLVACAEGLNNLPPADAKIAATALQGVIEYIEVTRLRGGIKAHMDKDDNYTAWKALQARAGKALLKFHKPETAPIPTFDTLDLDR